MKTCSGSVQSITAARSHGALVLARSRSMDAQCRTFWRWYILATAAAAAAAAIIPAAAVATGDACSAGPWSETACCTGMFSSM